MGGLLLSHACTEAEWLALAVKRRRAIDVLAENGQWRAAYESLFFLAECCVKAAIARRHRYNEWPRELHTHDLETLATRGGIIDDIRKMGQDNRKFADHWMIVASLSDRRYTVSELPNGFVNDVRIALIDPVDGVVKCLACI